MPRQQPEPAYLLPFNNPDIVEGLSRDEIDAAIKRHAEYEVLNDKPWGAPESGTDAAAAAAQDQLSFEQTVIDNLRKAGIQNGRKAERIEFDALGPFAGRYVQAVGSRVDAETGEETRVAVAIGPQYGTVSQAFARDAVREAVEIGGIDLLCVLGFAFDAHAGEGADLGEGFEQVGRERRFGSVTLLTVRMNVDLLMGEALKKTGAGNLFTVFGEPDIELTRPDAWGTLYSTTSRPFPVPSTGRIAVKVINDYGDEVMKVFEVA